MLIVFGLVGCSGVAVLAAILFPVFSQTKIAAIRTACLSNVKQQSLGVVMYSNDYDEKLPNTSKWVDATFAYTKADAIYRCPKVPAGEYGYAFNADLLGKSLRKLPAPSDSIIIFESTDTSRNATGKLKREAIAERHGPKASFGFADGHCKSMSRGQVRPTVVP